MAKEVAIKVEGQVEGTLANTQFRVERDVGGDDPPTSPGRCADTSSGSSRETG
jgi:hypothetical protein